MGKMNTFLIHTETPFGRFLWFLDVLSVVFLIFFGFGAFDVFFYTYFSPVNYFH